MSLASDLDVQHHEIVELCAHVLATVELLRTVEPMPDGKVHVDPKLLSGICDTLEGLAKLTADLVP